VHFGNVGGGGVEILGSIKQIVLFQVYMNQNLNWISID
jgi:hypothetical protein